MTTNHHIARVPQSPEKNNQKKPILTTTNIPKIGVEQSTVPKITSNHGNTEANYEKHKELIDSVLDIDVQQMPTDQITKIATSYRIVYLRTLKMLKSSQEQKKCLKEELLVSQQLVRTEREKAFLFKFHEIVSSLLRGNKEWLKKLFLFCPFPCMEYVKKWTNQELIRLQILPGKNNRFCDFLFDKFVDTHTSSQTTAESSPPPQLFSSEFRKTIWLNCHIGITCVRALSRMRSDQLGHVKNIILQETPTFSDSQKRLFYAKIFYSTFVFNENKICWEMIMKILARIYHAANPGTENKSFEDIQHKFIGKKLPEVLTPYQISFYILSIRKISCCLGEFDSIGILSQYLVQCAMIKDPHSSLAGLEMDDVNGATATSKKFLTSQWSHKNFQCQGFNQYHLDSYVSILVHLETHVLNNSHNEGLIWSFCSANAILESTKNIKSQSVADQVTVFEQKVTKADMQKYSSFEL